MYDVFGVEMVSLGRGDRQALKQLRVSKGACRVLDIQSFDLSRRVHIGAACSAAPFFWEDIC